MGNFFFSWPGAQIVCVCWGGVLCWGFNNRNSLCNMKIFAAKNLCSLQKLMCNYSLKPVLPSFLILARNSRWPFIAQTPLSSPTCSFPSLACPNTLFWKLMLFWKLHPLFSSLGLIFQIMSLSWIGEWVDTGCNLDLLKNISSSPCQESIELN